MHDILYMRHVWTCVKEWRPAASDDGEINGTVTEACPSREARRGACYCNSCLDLTNRGLHILKMYKQIDQSGSLAKTEPQDPTSISDIRFSTQSYINQYAN